jgi:DNA polymerase-3 subunit delta'
MLPDGANSLLKTFEEPTLDSLIILISSSPEMLLPTIVSRCQLLYFQPMSNQEIASYLCTECRINSMDAERIAQLARGSIGKALQLLKPDAELFRKSVLEILSRIKNISYPELLNALCELNEQMENKKKGWADSVRKQKGKDKNFTAAEQEGLQRELDGFVSLNTFKEMEILFEIILSWYRDLHLVAVRGNPELMIHKDFRAEIEAMASHGSFPSLEDMMRNLAEAKTAFTRSAPFQSVMETLFLKAQLATCSKIP